MRRGGLVWLALGAALGAVLAAGGVPAAAWSILRQGTFPTHLNAVAWSPGGTRAIAAGERGLVAASSDAGATWEVRPTCTALDLTAVCWQSETRIWATIGDHAGWLDLGGLILSTDGGLSWSTVIDGLSDQLGSISFADYDHGWVSGGGPELRRTTDGGASWDVLALPTVSPRIVHFLDETNGAGLDGFSIYRTSDGGASWEARFEDGSSSTVALSFPNPLEGFACSLLRVSATTDGGANWESRHLFSGLAGELFAADFATPDLGWAAGMFSTFSGGGARIEGTTDGGVSWTVQPVSGAARFKSLAARDAASVLAAGGHGLLARTTDGGASWVSAAAHSAEHLLGLHMTSALAGWAAGDPGVVLRTSDGGASWSYSSLGTTLASYNSVFALDAQHIFAAGTSCFASSTDGGASWTPNVSGPAYGSGIRFADALHGWVGGRYGVYYTEDGGANWSIIGFTSTGGVFDFAWLDEDTVYAAAGLSTVLGSTDGGFTWNTVYSHGVNNYLRALHFPDPLHGWAVGEEVPTGAAIILATTDGGATWNGQTSGVAADLYDVHFWDSQNGFAVGEGGLILATSNGGASWTPETSPVTTSLRAIAVLDPGQVWIGGDFGTLLIPGGTPAPTGTPTRTPTVTPPASATPTRTPSPSATRTPTATPTRTATATASPTATPSGAPSSTPTFTPSRTPTASPTASPTATGQPSSTPTPTSTATASPTATPSGAPSSTPTASPTASPTDSPTATATASPTATPEPPTATPAPTEPPSPTPECVALGVELAMPGTHFRPGDPCGLTAYLCNPGAPLAAMPVFVILDVLGSYWFAPGWAAYPPEIDYFELPIPSGLSEVEVIPEFAWPEVEGAFDGIVFWGAILDPGFSQIQGQLGMWEFGYGP